MRAQEDIARSIPQWIKKPKNSTDIIISSRARIARNLKGFPYLYKLTAKHAEELIGKINSSFQNFSKPNNNLIFINLSHQTNQFKQLLKERFLVTDYLMKGENKEIIIDEKENINILVNEEDHLRIQAIYQGFNIKKAYQTIVNLENRIEEKFEFDFHHEFGYLTSCPTNLGTGLRLSVMMHLPALVLTNKINNLIDNLVEAGFTIRGFFGEGSKYLGNVYQVSNQISLGVDEQEVLLKVENIILEIEKLELKARRSLQKNKAIKEKIIKSYVLLKNSVSLKLIDAMNYISLLKLGIFLNIININNIKEIDQLLILIQPIHISYSSLNSGNEELNVTLENKLRAQIIKDILLRGKVCLNNSQREHNRL